MITSNKVVAVGMSGGVDSSVVALLLKQQGYEVFGLFMKNWEDEKLACNNAEKDYADVLSVCNTIGIPCYSINFAKEYKSRVFDVCVNDLKQGLTPNPDTLCNREIKFSLLLEKAKILGADLLATGHYCGIRHDDENKSWLIRGMDENKDQSYFLYTITEDKLKQVLFPIQNLKKEQVRALALEHGLITASKKDSVGICFIGKRNFKDFMMEFIPQNKGEIKTLDGKIVGEHDGVAFYTIGQRKGLNIGGPGEAWFIAKKDVESNTLFVVQGDSHDFLYSKGLIATKVNWITKNYSEPFDCTAKIRYRSPDVKCSVSTLSNGDLHVLFQEPQKAVTEGQAIVFYLGSICLGGAVIKTQTN